MPAKLSEPNEKLGRDIWGWSIPPRKTCPGATAACLAVCYATRGRYVMPTVKNLAVMNLEAADQADFPKLMSAMLLVHRVRTLRIHVSGDFYDAAYIAKWMKIVRVNPRVTFYAYTRSWFDPKTNSWSELVTPLLKLAAEPNVALWLSEDKDTCVPPKSKHVRYAYMATEDGDDPQRPVDLVFRNRRVTIKKKVNKVQVCPVENGVATQVKITCSACRLCLFKNRGDRGAVRGSGGRSRPAGVG